MFLFKTSQSYEIVDRWIKKKSKRDKNERRDKLIEKIIGRKIGSFSLMSFNIHYAIMIMMMTMIMCDYSLILMKRNFLDGAD